MLRFGCQIWSLLMQTDSIRWPGWRTISSQMTLLLMFVASCREGCCHLTWRQVKFFWSWTIREGTGSPLAVLIQRLWFTIACSGMYVKSQVASLIHTQVPTIEFNFMDSQIQSGGCDCGLFAITDVTALTLGQDPDKLFFDQMKMRQHLFQCLERRKILPFPVNGSRWALKRVASIEPFYVHCVCRMPEKFNEEWPKSGITLTAAWRFSKGLWKGTRNAQSV